MDSKLLQSLSKVNLLRELTPDLDKITCIEKNAQIRREIIYDENFYDELVNKKNPSTLYCDFVNKVNSALIELIQSEEDNDIKINHLLMVFSISHNVEYTSIEQLLYNGNFVYLDIPLLNCIDNKIFPHVEELISIIYMNVFDEKAKVTFTIDKFQLCFPNLKNEFVDKYIHCLEFVFGWERLMTMCRSIADPFNLRNAILEIVKPLLKEIEHETTFFIFDKWKTFVQDRFKDIHDCIYSVLEYDHKSFLWEEMKCQDCINCIYDWKVDCNQIAERFADVVADRCNLFAYANEDSNFFKTVFSAYASIGKTIVENSTEEGRNQIKRDVFREISWFISHLYDESFKNLFSRLNHKIVRH